MRLFLTYIRTNHGGKYTFIPTNTEMFSTILVMLSLFPFLLSFPLTLPFLLHSFPLTPIHFSYPFPNPLPVPLYFALPSSTIFLFPYPIPFPYPHLHTLICPPLLISRICSPLYLSPPLPFPLLSCPFPFPPSLSWRVGLTFIQTYPIILHTPDSSELCLG